MFLSPLSVTAEKMHIAAMPHWRFVAGRFPVGHLLSGVKADFDAFGEPNLFFCRQQGEFLYLTQIPAEKILGALERQNLFARLSRIFLARFPPVLFSLRESVEIEMADRLLRYEGLSDVFSKSRRFCQCSWRTAQPQHATRTSHCCGKVFCQVRLKLIGDHDALGVYNPVIRKYLSLSLNGPSIKGAAITGQQMLPLVTRQLVGGDDESSYGKVLRHQI